MASGGIDLSHKARGAIQTPQGRGRIARPSYHPNRHTPRAAAPMYRPVTDQEKLFQIAAACHEAILAQRQRESGQGYGLDDYTEGRIVGAASLARKIMRTLASGQPDASSLRARSNNHARR